MDQPERYEFDRYTLIIENSPSPEACENLLRVLASIPTTKVEYEGRVTTTE